MSDFAIEVRALTKVFGKFISVDAVDFNVKRGSVFGFLGANGAGKSTTIRMLCGIIEPTSGDALVNGFSVSKETEQVKQSIGYMSQKFSLYNDLSILENIRFFGGIYGMDGARLRERTEWVLDTARLRGREKTLTGILPGGIKQRLALALGVIHEPGIVFLDEPTSGVDPVSRRSFWELIQNLSEKGTTVFVTTHYLEEAEYCDSITFINAGKIVARGTPTELKTNQITAPMYEIETPEPFALMRYLETAPYARDVSLFGVNVHLLMKDTAFSADMLASDFASANIPLTRIDRIVPTLEDVFINVLDEKGGA